MEKLIVSSSPHFGGKIKTKHIMADVVIALVPAAIASVIFFGLNALILIAVCIIGAFASEFVCRKVMKRTQTVSDNSAVVTGLLVAFNLPPDISPIIALFGVVIAIVVVKQMFGGIGQNFVNPALTARIILMNSFPVHMTTWSSPFDGVTTATPLAVMAQGGELPSYLDMFLGTTGGCLGETSALALIIGGVYLVLRKVISPVIPLTYMGATVLMAVFLGRDPIAELLTGGLMLGAIFMATDYTTSPITTKARIVFAIGCGVLTVLIREFGSLPEGVSYSIVVMNILVPLIERMFTPKPFGYIKPEKKGA